MKYKVITLIAALILVCSTFVAAVYPSTSEDYGANRYHQHMEAQEKEPCYHTDDSFCTHLPLVSIDTDGQEIPGHKYYDENGVSHTILTPDGKDYIEATIDVFDSAEKNNHLTDDSSIASSMRISVRGRTSRYFDKSGYSVTLIDENGENNAQEMMGMDSHHDWVIHGPFLDKTLIRNYMWYNISGNIMSYAPNVRFFEMFIDGEYMGVYLMVESVTAGKDSRLNLSVSKKNNTFTGYCLRLDNGSSEIKNLNTFSMYTYRNKFILNMVYPGKSNITPELKKAIEADFSEFERIMYSYDYNDSKYGYKNYIDMESFINYFIITEFTCNYDVGALSTYIYKEAGGLYEMCVWDFNNSCDNFQEQPIDRKSMVTHKTIWYNMLTKDADFVEEIIDTYKKLRKTYLNEEYLEAYIDDTIAYLGDAVARNNERWSATYGEDFNGLYPADRNAMSYEEAVADIKDFIAERGAWLDANIESLRQYASDSKNKKHNEAGGD
jgi:hypothetical protein